MAATTDQHALILDHLSLATRLARGFRGRGVDLDDLEQVARLALVKAAAGFDAARGEFPAFAAATIRGEIKRYFRDRAWSVRPPRRVQETQALIQAEHCGSSLTTADVASLADRLGVPVAEVSEAAAARGCYSPDSLDAAEGGGHLTGVADPRLDQVDEWLTLLSLWRGLPVADRQLLRWRFVDDLTQQAIADRLGISQMQVSRRLSALLTRLRIAADSESEAA
jgi:RNA polymerase sigma-B factor